LTCTGYDKDLVFVNRTPKKLTATAATVLSDIRKRKLQNQRLSGPLNVESNLGQSIVELFSPTCHYLELRRHAVQLLQKLYLPSDYEGDSDYSQTCWGWVLSISELTGVSQALDMAVQSLCVVQSYVHGIHGSTIEQSLHLYNSALQKLREDVDSHASKPSKETLAAIVVLSTTEVHRPLSSLGPEVSKMLSRCF
jgi:hypothetical protein